ncbi:MAG: hypothetical protein ABI658_28240 [Acidimicrobiales bacterium]
MTRVDGSELKRNNAVFVYVVLMLALQVFLLVVALEAFQADEESLAWPSAGLSALLFVTVLAFARLLRHD